MFQTPTKPTGEARPPPVEASSSTMKPATAQGTLDSGADLAAISIQTRLPEFWAEMPRLWFAQTESILGPQKQGDEAKFNLVVAKLGRDALQQVSDILLSPPATGKYDAIKERLLQTYEESASRQFQKLVSEMELGSQKPSQLLRRMRDLGRNTQVSEQTLHNLWIARLPNSMRAVLTVSQDQTLENLANIADKIMENIKSNEIAEICSSPTVCSQIPVSDILKQMHNLNLEVAALREEVQNHRRSEQRGRGFERGHAPYRGRWRSRSRSRMNNNPNWLCRFHYKYREKATKCEKPCAWKSTSSSSSGAGN